MFIAPLALLSLVYSRKKKRGKLDTFIILLVLGATLSMSLAACGENPAQVSTPFGTVTGIATQASTSTSTLAVTATLTPYIPTPTGGTAVGTPTLTCTATGMFTNLNTKIIFLVVLMDKTLMTQDLILVFKHLYGSKELIKWFPSQVVVLMEKRTRQMLLTSMPIKMLILL